MPGYERYEKTVDIKEYVANCVDVDTFIKLCQECTNYGVRWSCPPYDFSPVDLWNSYSKFRVIGYKFFTDSELSIEENIQKFMKLKDDMYIEMMELEKEIPGSMMLAAGNCSICKECSKGCGEPCRFPEKMRYSIESLGGNVGKTAKDYLDLKIKWIKDGQMPDYLLRVGGLLLK